MANLQTLLKTIRGVSRKNPVTQLQLSEIIRTLWNNRVDEVYGELAGNTDFTERHVEFEFSKPFPTKPKYADLKVYRMKQVSAGWRMYDVLYTHAVENWFDATGFQLDIDSREEIEGIVIRYYFK